MGKEGKRGRALGAWLAGALLAGALVPAGALAGGAGAVAQGASAAADAAAGAAGGETAAGTVSFEVPAAVTLKADAEGNLSGSATITSSTATPICVSNVKVTAASGVTLQSAAPAVTEASRKVRLRIGPSGGAVEASACTSGYAVPNADGDDVSKPSPWRMSKSGSSVSVGFSGKAALDGWPAGAIDSTLATVQWTVSDTRPVDYAEAWAVLAACPSVTDMSGDGSAGSTFTVMPTRDMEPGSGSSYTVPADKSIQFTVLDTAAAAKDYGGCIIVGTTRIVANGRHSTSRGNTCSWEKSLVREWCKTTFPDALPSDFAGLFRTVETRTNAGGKNTTDVITTKDKFFLPTPNEVGVTVDSGNIYYKENHERYEHYSTAANRKKAGPNTSSTVNIWWLRSPSRISNTQFGYVGTNGGANNVSTDPANVEANDVHGIAPVGCI